MNASQNGGDPRTYKSMTKKYTSGIVMHNFPFLEVEDDNNTGNNYQNQLNANVSPLDDATTINGNSFTTDTQQTNSSASSNDHSKTC